MAEIVAPLPDRQRPRDRRGLTRSSETRQPTIIMVKLMSEVNIDVRQPPWLDTNRGVGDCAISRPYGGPREGWRGSGPAAALLPALGAGGRLEHVADGPFFPAADAGLAGRFGRPGTRARRLELHRHARSSSAGLREEMGWGADGWTGAEALASLVLDPFQLSHRGAKLSDQLLARHGFGAAESCGDPRPPEREKRHEPTPEGGPAGTRAPHPDGPDRDPGRQWTHAPGYWGG